MPTEIIGTLQVRRQRKKRADGTTKTDVKLFVYIPTALWRDSQFPFELKTQNLQIRIVVNEDTRKGMLVVGKAPTTPCPLAKECPFGPICDTADPKECKTWQGHELRVQQEKASNKPGRGE